MTLRTRRPPRSLLSDATTARFGGRYDEDHRPPVDELLQEMLPGQSLGSGLADIDDGGESIGPAPFEPTDAELTGEEITVPVIPRRADEFVCSSCFLILHKSRLADSRDGRPLCMDCA
ncbi:MAG: DUF4193 family protein [Mycobacterium sp.]|uniref:DUF4193 family protein n=1 Tax=Mycobacterium sp. TaxID=1785 RepID=UPI00261796C7|nr:DUF4193 family protein [Mycobacterium sp.]MDI3315323.1 DUF4193 family protein [Mycobacterium sp.]